jgi:RecG-like helicase
MALMSTVFALYKTYYPDDEFGDVQVPANVNRRIEGVVGSGATPIADVIVLLVSKDSLKIVASARTNSLGEYAFTNVRDDREYLVLALSPDVAANSQVKDFVEGVA